VLEDAILHSHFFGDRTLRAETLASSLVGSLARRNPEDLAILNKYWHGVVEPHSKQEGGHWTAFLNGGRRTLETLS
jgi:hypothetical protein